MVYIFEVLFFIACIGWLVTIIHFSYLANENTNLLNLSINRLCESTHGLSQSNLTVHVLYASLTELLELPEDKREEALMKMKETLSQIKLDSRGNAYSIIAGLYKKPNADVIFRNVRDMVDGSGIEFQKDIDQYLTSPRPGDFDGDQLPYEYSHTSFEAPSTRVMNMKDHPYDILRWQMPKSEPEKKPNILKRFASGLLSRYANLTKVPVLFELAVEDSTGITFTGADIKTGFKPVGHMPYSDDYKKLIETNKKLKEFYYKEYRLHKKEENNVHSTGAEENKNNEGDDSVILRKTWMEYINECIDEIPDVTKEDIRALNEAGINYNFELADLHHELMSKEIKDASKRRDKVIADFEKEVEITDLPDGFRVQTKDEKMQNLLNSKHRIIENDDKPLDDDDTVVIVHDD